MANRTPVSGVQHTIRSGDYEATIASVGASLRTLRHAGRDLIVPFNADTLRTRHRGATLAPWPNRVVDGKYSFNAQELALPITERANGHAIHGLVSWLQFEVVDAAPDRVTLTGTIEPQSGYPWRVAVDVTFALGADGLTQTVTGRNLSERAVPWGTAAHPYLVAGESELDSWTLHVPATEVLLTSQPRQIPTELVAVDGPDPQRFDWRTPRVIGQTKIDHTFTRLLPGADGGVAVTVTDPAGTGVRVTLGDACPWAQVFTSDLPGGVATLGNRDSVAVEPMTCAPDAFNASNYPFDTGLIVLEPDAESSASWRIDAL